MSARPTVRLAWGLAVLAALGASLAAQTDNAPAAETTGASGVDATPGDTTGATATPAKTRVESGGVFSWPVLSSSGVVGLIIAFLAFVLLTLVVYDFLTLRRGVFIPSGFLAEAAELLRNGQARRMLEVCQTDPSLLSRAVAAGLTRRADGYDEMIDAVETVGQEESMKLHQNVGYLALIGSVSPMLGLLGTVYGMILSFQTVSEAAGSVQPARLAGGIYTALTTTLMGLIVAIPAMSAYVYFRNRVLNRLNETAVVVEELFFPFKKGRFAEAAAPKARAGARGVAPGGGTGTAPATGR